MITLLEKEVFEDVTLESNTLITLNGTAITHLGLMPHFPFFFSNELEYRAPNYTK